MVMSDIGDINSPRTATVGSLSTRVDPKLFGKPSDFSEDRRECEEVGLVSRVYLLSGEVRSVTTALKDVEEVQEGLQEIEDE